MPKSRAVEGSEFLEDRAQRFMKYGKSLMSSIMPNLQSAADGRSFPENRVRRFLAYRKFQGLDSSGVRVEGPFIQLDKHGYPYRQVFLAITFKEFIIIKQSVEEDDATQDSAAFAEITNLSMDHIIPLGFLKFFIIDDRAMRLTAFTFLDGLYHFEMCQLDFNTNTLWKQWREIILCIGGERCAISGFHSWTTSGIERGTISGIHGDHLRTSAANQTLFFYHHPFAFSQVNSVAVQTDGPIDPNEQSWPFNGTKGYYVQGNSRPTVLDSSSSSSVCTVNSSVCTVNSRTASLQTKRLAVLTSATNTNFVCTGVRRSHSAPNMLMHYEENTVNHLQHFRSCGDLAILRIVRKAARNEAEHDEDVDTSFQEAYEKARTSRVSASDFWKHAAHLAIGRKHVITNEGRFQKIAARSFALMNREQTRSVSLLAIQPSDVAEYLVFMSKTIFLAITEVDVHRYVTSNGKQVSNSIVDLSTYECMLVKLVTTETIEHILEQKGVTLIKFFIKICQILLFTHRDFPSVIGLLKGLSSLAVYHLRNTWANLLVQEPLSLSSLVAMLPLISPEHSCQAYCNRIQNCLYFGHSFIPWARHFLHHCVDTTSCRKSNNIFMQLQKITFDQKARLFYGTLSKMAVTSDPSGVTPQKLRGAEEMKFPSKTRVPIKQIAELKSDETCIDREDSTSDSSEEETLRSLNYTSTRAQSAVQAIDFYASLTAKNIITEVLTHIAFLESASESTLSKSPSDFQERLDVIHEFEEETEEEMLAFEQTYDETSKATLKSNATLGINPYTSTNKGEQQVNEVDNTRFRQHIPKELTSDPSLLRKDTSSYSIVQASSSITKGLKSIVSKKKPGFSKVKKKVNFRLKESTSGVTPQKLRGAEEMKFPSKTRVPIKQIAELKSDETCIDREDSTSDSSEEETRRSLNYTSTRAQSAVQAIDFYASSTAKNIITEVLTHIAFHENSSESTLSKSPSDDQERLDVIHEIEEETEEEMLALEQAYDETSKATLKSNDTFGKNPSTSTNKEEKQVNEVNNTRFRQPIPKEKNKIQKSKPQQNKSIENTSESNKSQKTVKKKGGVLRRIKKIFKRNKKMNKEYVSDLDSDIKDIQALIGSLKGHTLDEKPGSDAEENDTLSDIVSPEHRRMTVFGGAGRRQSLFEASIETGATEEEKNQAFEEMKSSKLSQIKRRGSIALDFLKGEDFNANSIKKYDLQSDKAEDGIFKTRIKSFEKMVPNQGNNSVVKVEKQTQQHKRRHSLNVVIENPVIDKGHETTKDNLETFSKLKLIVRGVQTTTRARTKACLNNIFATNARLSDFQMLHMSLRCE
ncbi:uncharacterized protein LOC127871372 isoform X1 [Dreissena polymorpha]|uniref:Ras-GEF domain-containing protein n=1 Tax=Dreissena polymorpha TaxID=45954 RepID=A0A9D4RQM8_DREPO|nr:uncharacterized protein LOC127871372 isoform X1 [Dreissena polymorpha]KAH3877319.1 hypothetical protein DPMN_001182 [Dreissena polymorpha]